MGTEPSPSLFGIDTAVYGSSQAYYERGMPTARSLGARWDHFTAGAETGSGDFGALDREVRRARSNGMGVVVSVGGIRDARPMRPQPANIHACPPTTGKDLRSYESYFRQLVLRYRNVVEYYESWTEDNNGSSWLPGPNPARYAALLKAQCSVIQSVNRQYGLRLQLLFGSPSGFQVNNNANWEAVVPFTNQVLKDLHRSKPFDGVAPHAYRTAGQRRSVGSGVRLHERRVGLTGIQQFHLSCAALALAHLGTGADGVRQLFSAHGYGQPPLWLTEFGWPGNAVADGSYFPSAQDQAADLAEAYEDLLQLPFVKGAMWFNLRDYEPGYQSPDPSFSTTTACSSTPTPQSPPRPSSRRCPQLTPGARPGR